MGDLVSAEMRPGAGRAAWFPGLVPCKSGRGPSVYSPFGLAFNPTRAVYKLSGGERSHPSVVVLCPKGVKKVQVTAVRQSGPGRLVESSPMAPVGAVLAPLGCSASPSGAPKAASAQRTTMQNPQTSINDHVEDPSHLIGTIVADKWRVLSLLGAGGTAAVYSAVHVNNGRKVALKVLHRSVAQSEAVKERFFEEAFAANQIDHPGTVPAFDDGFLDDGRPFLVLELLEGECLHAMWERRGMVLSVREALQIGQAVLSILGAAHQKGILHRDIKPENLFISARGEIKLLDFGIAKVADSLRSYKTTVGEAMGTPAFMPPEQARGRWDEVDERSDLWAVAATLFTLLTGHCIHEGGTTNEVLLSAMCHSAPPIRTLRPELPAFVALVIDRGLSFNKSERFASAREMYDALGECLARLPVGPSEAPPRSERRRIFGPSPVGTRDTMRSRAPINRTTTKVASALLALTAAAGAAAWFGVSAEDVRTVLVQKPNGTFAHLPWDLTLQADKSDEVSTGTVEGVTVATQVAFSEGGPAPAEPEIVSLLQPKTRYQSETPVLIQEELLDSDPWAESPHTPINSSLSLTH